MGRNGRKFIKNGGICLEGWEQGGDIGTQGGKKWGLGDGFGGRWGISKAFGAFYTVLARGERAPCGAFPARRLLGLFLAVSLTLADRGALLLCVACVGGIAKFWASLFDFCHFLRYAWVRVILFWQTVDV